MSLAGRFRPLLNRILVERAQPPQKTKGGVLLPEKSQDSHEAVVVAVGPGLRTNDGKTVPTTVQVGDRVLLPEYGVNKVKFDDKEYHLVREDDILGILPK